MGHQRGSTAEELLVHSDGGSVQAGGPAVERPPSRFGRGEVLVALAAFAALCVAALARAVQLLEPDDLAYRASILALTHGHLLSLTNAEYQALLKELSSGGGQGIAQWVQTTGGAWISEKNPGYPFLAAPFQALGLLRVAPLFCGALGCVGLFVGARRWLGRWGGAWAVVLFCSSGAALAFAWRPTMPTFTDASLIAAGAGALLWALLATERTARRRTIAGLLGFVALEAAVLVRYTNVVLLAVSVLAALLVFRRQALPLRAVGWWLGSVAVLVAALLGIDYLAYGNALKTGYSSGEITFSLSSVIPNLQQMPAPLVKSMPMVLLALGALGWQAVRAVSAGRRGTGAASRAGYRRDAVISGFLAMGWIGIWGLYSAYEWTTRMAGGTGAEIHVIRFYLPALGLITLLAAWLLVQLPRWLTLVALIVVIGLGILSYPDLAAGGMGPGGGGPGGRPGIGGPGGPPPGVGGPGGAPGGVRGGPPPAVSGPGGTPPNG
ncbi:MAG: hypothetical protein ABI903_11195 [Actinomycetota bacterium]